MTTQLPTEQQLIALIERIKSEAASKSVYDDEDDDDYNPYDASGGNFDDAFSNGIDEGFIMFARVLMDIIKTE